MDESRRLESGTLINIGEVQLCLGRRHHATEVVQQALQLSRAAGDRALEASALYLLCRARAGGQDAEARRLAQAALAVYEELGDPRARQVWAHLQGRDHGRLPPARP